MNPFLRTRQPRWWNANLAGCIMLLWTLFCLVMFGGMIWAAIHFIVKYW